MEKNNHDKMEMELELLQLRRQLGSLEGKSFDIINEVVEEKIAEIETAIEEETQR